MSQWLREALDRIAERAKEMQPMAAKALEAGLQDALAAQCMQAVLDVRPGADMAEFEVHLVRWDAGDHCVHSAAESFLMGVTFGCSASSVSRLSSWAWRLRLAKSAS